MITTHGTYKIVSPPYSATLTCGLSIVILELRLYAMYGRSKKILALLFVLISCEATAMGVLFGVNKAVVICECLISISHMMSIYNYTGTNNPYNGVFICADGDPLDGSHWIMYYWVAFLSI